MKKVLVDTNSLLDGFEVVDGYKYIALSHVNREIDKHKQFGDGELKFKARRATRFIDDNDEIFEYDVKNYTVKFDKDADNNYTDNKIVQACLDNGYSVMTNDLNLKHLAKAYGIEIIASGSSYREDAYKGIKEIKLDDESIANFYENLFINTFNLHTNEYIIINNKKGKFVDKYRWDGKSHVKLSYPNIKKFKGKNHQQDCAIDLLNNVKIPIKIIAGTYGSGKTLLSVKLALHHVMDEGNYAKIMMVRNPIGSGKEIGFLKGTKEDKTEGFFKPLVQHLDGGDQEATILEQKGVLTKEIPFYMKGLSIEDTIILCDEAEDLDVKLIRLIGTRLGEDSAVIFSGDYNQVESEYKNNNGLIRAIEKLKGNPLVGIVVLDEDVRSAASKVFAELE